MMWGIVLQFTASALVIIGAGSFLTRCADSLAEETGLGRVLVGSLLLAGATSLPELMVDLHAVWLNQPDLAVGDLLGSSLFNLLILASLDSIFRPPRSVFSSEFIHHAQTAVVSICVTALAGIGILFRLSWSFLGIGLFTWIVGAGYLVGMKSIYSSETEKKAELNPRRDRRILSRAITGFVASAGVILIAAPYLVRAADQIAQRSGLGHTFVGTTLVAFSTSLPELVATLASFRMGAPDLALANIFGSNTFNMLLFFPLDAFFPATLFSSVHASHALTAFCVVAVSSVAVLGQVSQNRGKAHFLEPGSKLILMMIFGFLYLLYRMKVS